MPYDIGPRVGVTGEKEFNRQMREINDTIKLLGSQMNALSKEYDDNADSLEYLSKRNDLLNDEADVQRQKLALLESQYEKQSSVLSGLREELARTAAEYGENSTEAAKLENQISKQESTLSKLGVAINETNGYISSLNSQIDKNSAKMDEMAYASKESESALGKLKSEIAAQEQELQQLEKAYQDAYISKGKYSGETKQLADQISKLSGELKQNKTSLSNAESESRKLAGALDDVDDSAKDAGDGFTVMKGALADITADGIQDIAGTLKDIAFESDNASAKLEAMTGASAVEMTKLNAQIEELYKNNVSDDMNEIADSMAKVKQQMKELDDTQLSNVTASLLTLQDTFDMDFNETLRGSKQLMEQFGLSAEESIDLIAAGAQSGLNYTDELGDNISEYAGKFSQAGYSAEEYFQLLANGSENGAYNLDKVNDAINEVTTRLADGTIEESLEMFDDDVQKVFKSWKKGGATQKDVIDAIVKDIKETTNEQEKLTKAAEAFGTMGEDANAKFVESLTSVGDEFSDVSGKMQQINTVRYDTAENRIKTLGKRLQSDFVAPIVEDALPVLEDGIDWMIDNLPFVETALVGVGTAWGTAFAAKHITSAITSVQDLGKKLTEISGTSIPYAKDALSKLGNLISAHPLLTIGGVVLGVGTALLTMAANTREASAALKENAEEAQKQLEAWEEMTTATDEAIASAAGEYDYLVQLKAELMSITDQNGKVKESYEERAAFIVGELNEALGTEIEMNNGIIQSYQEQMSTLDQLIEKQRAKAYIDSGQEAYAEAVKNQAQALQDMLAAEETYAEEKKRIEDMIAEHSNMNWTEEQRRNYEKWAWQDQDYLNAKQAYEDKKALAEDYTQTIADQEYLMQLYASGTAEDMQKINEYVASSYEENGKIVQASVEEQIKMEEERLAFLKESNTEASEDQIRASEERLERLRSELQTQKLIISGDGEEVTKEWRKVSKNGLDAYSSNEYEYYNAAFAMTEMAKDGVVKGNPDTDKAWRALADAGYAELDGKTWKYTTAGENYVTGLKQGIENKQTNVFTAVSTMASNMVTTLFRGLQEHSPSKAAFEGGDNFTLGAIQGVENRQQALYRSIDKMGEEMTSRFSQIQKESVEAGMEDLSAESRLLSNTRAIFENNETIVVQTTLDGRIIAENTVKYVTRSQSARNVMKGR